MNPGEPNMLDSNTRLRPNTDDVAAKVIDGEAIIMNLSNGLYFSMDRVGSAVWEMVEAGLSVDEMSSTLDARYDVDQEVIRDDVNRLVTELLTEELVLVIETGPESHTSDRGAADHPYSSPTLSKYDDMADLLALDPPMPGLGTLPE
jgi:hypothetical protein